MSYQQLNASNVNSLSGQNQYRTNSYGQAQYSNLSEVQKQYAMWMQMLYGIRSENLQGSDQNNQAGTGGSAGSSSLLGTVLGGLSQAAQTLGKVKNWFISQIKGPANKNEDAGEMNGNCGPTALAMILVRRGLEGMKDPNGLIEYIREKMGANTKEEGRGSWTSAGQIAQGAKEYGLDATSSSKNTIEDVKAALNDGKDVITLIRPNGPKSGHFVVVRGIKGNTVLLADPSKQGFTQISLQEYIEKFQGGYMATIG